MSDEFNRAIAEELLLDVDKTITQETMDLVWSKCNGNPWNAPILHALMQQAKTSE